MSDTLDDIKENEQRFFRQELLATSRKQRTVDAFEDPILSKKWQKKGNDKNLRGANNPLTNAYKSSFPDLTVPSGNLDLLPCPGLVHRLPSLSSVDLPFVPWNHRAQDENWSAQNYQEEFELARLRQTEIKLRDARGLFGKSSKFDNNVYKYIRDGLNVSDPIPSGSIWSSLESFPSKFTSNYLSHSKSKWLHIKETAASHPESLYTSSCLRILSRAGQSCLAYSDLGNGLHWGDLRKNEPGKASLPLFPYTLHKEANSSLVDYTDLTRSRIFGFDWYPDSELFAIRYKQSISLIEHDGNIVESYPATSSPLVSHVCSKLTDSMSTLTVNGTLSSTNIETRTPINSMENYFVHQMYPFLWGKLVLGPDLETRMRVVLRKCALVLDQRTGKVADSAYEVDIDSPDHSELITDLCQSQHHENQVYCLTSQSLHLVDERYSKKPILTQCHLVNDDLPRGLSCQKFPDGCEYVSMYSASGQVQVSCLDWAHRDCRQEMVCLNPESRETPVVLGAVPLKIPGPGHIASQHFFSSPVAQKRLSIPWTGFTTVADTKDLTGIDKLTMFGLNAIGQLFISQLVSEDCEENSDRDYNFDRISEADVFSQSPRRSHGKIPKEIGPRLKKHLEEWNLQAEESAPHKIAKIGVAYSRPALPTAPDPPIKNSLPLLPVPFVRKRKRDSNNAALTSHSGKVRKLRRNVPKVFSTCPWLKPIDPEEHSDEEGKRISKILAGDNPYPDVPSFGCYTSGEDETSDSEAEENRSSVRTVSQSVAGSSRSSLSRRMRNLRQKRAPLPKPGSSVRSGDSALTKSPVLLPQDKNDSNYALDSFMHSIGPPPTFSQDILSPVHHGISVSQEQNIYDEIDAHGSASQPFGLNMQARHPSNPGGSQSPLLASQPNTFTPNRSRAPDMNSHRKKKKRRKKMDIGF